MGTRKGPIYWMTWQKTLGGMADAGVRVRQRCEACDVSADIDVGEWLAFYGPDHSLVNFRPPCDTCGVPTWFSASPGPSTPFRPLKD